MTLQRLARELDETARQTAEMVDAISGAITRFNSCSECRTATGSEVTTQIIRALQAQDRIEQRLANMTEAVRQLAERAKFAEDTDFDEIWASLTLDELRHAEHAPAPLHAPSGEIEFF